MAKKIIVLVLNALILLCEIRGFMMGISAEMFIYYTNLSNLMAAIACLLMVINFFCGFDERLHKAIVKVKYVATCMTTVTLLVVLCILVPMQGIRMLYSGNFLYFHLVCPILMLASFLFFENIKLEQKAVGVGVAPTLIYAVVTVVCNCLGILDGPYPFLRVRNQPIYMSIIWAIVVLGIAWLIAYLLMKLCYLREKF